MFVSKKYIQQLELQFADALSELRSQLEFYYNESLECKDREIFSLNQKISLILSEINREIVETPPIPKGLQIREKTF